MNTSIVIITAIIFIVGISILWLYDNCYLTKVKTAPCPKPNCGGTAKYTGWAFGWGEAKIYKCQKCGARTVLNDGKLTLPPLPDRDDEIPIYEKPLYILLHGRSN